MLPFLYQQISQKEVDLPLVIPDYKSSSTYPPMIKLHISITKQCAEESFCFLEVKGIDHKLKLMLKIVPHTEPQQAQAMKAGMCSI